MRRIYDSDALVRDDDDPFAPAAAPTTSRSIDWARASHALLPMAVRRRAIAVSIETDRDVYARGDPVRFRVRVRNRLPLPVVLPTTAPVPWTWSVDGHERATRPPRPLPSGGGTFRFAGRETKTFERVWPQRFRDSRREWSVAASGEHVVRAWVLSVGRPAQRPTAETALRIE